MKKIIENGAELMDVLSTSPVWDTLEAFARTSIQQWVQRLLIEEVDELLGRRKSERVHVGTQPVRCRCIGTALGRRGSSR